MNFKKVFGSVVSSMLMLGVLAGCGGNKESASTNTSTTAPTTTVATQAASTFKQGTRTDKEYKSEWLGIKYTLPENYIMMTDEQLKQAAKVGAEITGSNTGQMLDNVDMASMFEMYATNPTGESVIMVAEKLPITFNETQYAELIKSHIKQTDVSAVLKDITTREIGGVTFTELGTSMTLDGQKLYQTAFLKQLDDRMVVITCTCTKEDGLNTMLAGFSKL